jgi:Protein of unknown function (DUF2490)
MKKILVITALSAVSFASVKAQTPPTYTLPDQSLSSHPRDYAKRKSFWTEFNFQGSITEDKRWQYQIDYQYRRMAEASYVPNGQHSNIFKDPYQQVIRPWIHYWAIPGVLRFSLSPIGYWATWTPPSEGAYYSTAGKGGHKTFYPEFRTCPQMTLVNTYGRFQFFNRLRYEFRWIGSRVDSKNNAADFFQGDAYDFIPNGPCGSNHKGRMRWQIRTQILLNSAKMEKNSIYLNLWNELFIGIGRHVGYNQNLDQNRTVTMIGWKLPTEYPIKIEAGATFQQIFNGGTAGKIPVGTTGKAQGAEFNTAYTVYVIFDEFHKFRSKKKEKEESILQQENK